MGEYETRSWKLFGLSSVKDLTISDKTMALAYVIRLDFFIHRPGVKVRVIENTFFDQYNNTIFVLLKPSAVFCGVDNQRSVFEGTKETVTPSSMDLKYNL